MNIFIYTAKTHLDTPKRSRRFLLPPNYPNLGGRVPSTKILCMVLILPK